jgi:hypothetical protein
MIVHLGDRIADVANPTGMHASPCTQCGRWLMLEEPLEPGGVAACRRQCGIAAVFRAWPWLYVSPDYGALSRALRMPLSDVAPLPLELAALTDPARPKSQN